MGDDVVEALEDLVAGLQRNRDRIDQAIAQARIMAEVRGQGRPWQEILSGPPGAQVLDVIGQNLDELYATGSRLRRAQARALYDEGMSMEAIAGLFGVTRQRVGALLRDGTAKASPGAPPRRRAK